MARPAGIDVTAATRLHRALHEQGAHPETSDIMDPCDWCVDLTNTVVRAYGAAFAGGHGEQEARDVPVHGSGYIAIPATTYVLLSGSNIRGPIGPFPDEKAAEEFYRRRTEYTSWPEEPRIVLLSPPTDADASQEEEF